jgi:hypothetical protein
MSMVVVHVASGTRDILVFWAAWPRLWATLYRGTYSGPTEWLCRVPRGLVSFQRVLIQDQSVSYSGPDSVSKGTRAKPRGDLLGL